jgi:Na+-transporting methylmalonyl-CoA/oxaloacetate decarboxylase gamma subunit
VYIIGIPLFTWISLYRARKEIHSQRHNPILMMKLGQLYRAFESKYWYYEIIDMMRKLALTGGLILVGTGPTQILLGILVCLLYQALFLHTRPMLNDVDDWLQEFASWHLLIVLLTGLFLEAQVAKSKVSGDSFDDSIAGGLLVFMTVMTVLIFLLMLFLVLGGLEQKVRAFLAKRKAKKAAEKAEKAASAEGKERVASSPKEVASSSWVKGRKGEKAGGNQVMPAPNPAMEAKGNFAAAEAQMGFVLQPAAASADQQSLFATKQSEVSAPVPPPPSS